MSRPAALYHYQAHLLVHRTGRVVRLEHLRRTGQPIPPLVHPRSRKEYRAMNKTIYLTARAERRNR